MNIINNTKTAVRVFNGLNECANLFQWIIPAISSLKSKWNGTQKEKLQGRDVQQLQSDLQCLSDTLSAMYNLIDRAEWKIHEHDVADLLPKLKDAVYDAEDLLDEFRWYEQQLSVEGNAIPMEPVIAFFHSVTQGSFNNVTDIQMRLNDLSGKLKETGLLRAIKKFDKSIRPETSSFHTEEKIFGRVNEKNKLISLLGVPTNNSAGPSRCKRKRSGVGSSGSNQVCATVDSNEVTRNSVPEVLPIVGIGGVGKTTLAQDICNNSKVKRHFDLIIWICVSDDFDVKRFTKEAIVQSVGKVPENDNLNFLQRALANSLNTKRFLIVLDAIWDENKQHRNHFCAPFNNVVQGSMMLVTTRSPKVADAVHTESMDPFPLEGLKTTICDCESLEWVPAEMFADLRFLEKLRVRRCPKIKSQRLFAPSLKELAVPGRLWESRTQHRAQVSHPLAFSRQPSGIHPTTIVESSVTTGAQDCLLYLSDNY